MSSALGLWESGGGDGAKRESFKPFCSGCLEPLFLLSFWYFLRSGRPLQGFDAEIGNTERGREVDALVLSRCNSCSLGRSLLGAV